MVKFVLAPESFIGSLTALEVASLLAEEAERAFPGCETVRFPIADGGEGTLDALVQACGGEERTATVTGPDGTRVQARYGLLHGGRTAVIESAQACGLPLVKGEKDPLRATSRGVGELMLRALADGAQQLYVCLGGTATNDGGMGMLAALGARFLDAEGGELSGCGADLALLASADFSGLPAALLCAQITAVCDVTNPLLGPQGATAVYGPQKGVTPALQPTLENGMAHYAGAVQRALGRDVSRFAGAGAAGGLGAALGGVLGARMQSGIDAVLDAARFEERLKGCDLVVTGEGRLDGQSVRFGKAASGVKKRCQAYGIPVVALVGGMGEGAEAFYSGGGASVMTTVNGPMTTQEAMADAPALCRDAARRLFLLLRLGASLPRPAGKP